MLAVALHGELDFTNVSQIAHEVCTAIDTRRPTAVRVNLSGVTFLDSSGIGRPQHHAPELEQWAKIVKLARKARHTVTVLAAGKG